jgi:hypothetical protein
MAGSNDATAPEQPSPGPEEDGSSAASGAAFAAEGAGPLPMRLPNQGDAPTSPPGEPPLQIGQSVRLRHGVPYLRSAEPMPMLRPPDLVDREEVGQVQELRGLGRVAVRFRRGSFLLDAADLVAISES